MALYLQGALIGTGAIHPDTNLRTPSDNNNWLGRSQWPDPIFDGSFDEFRIYDTALSATAVADHFRIGPNLVPEPTTLAALALAVSGLAAARRRRRAPLPI